MTDSGRLDVYDGETLVASVQATAFTDEAPRYDRPRHPPKDLEARWVTVDMPPLADAGEARSSPGRARGSR